MKDFPNVLEHGIETVQSGVFPLAGNWSKDHFKNNNPLVLELACGKGEFALAMAKMWPERNYLGIDIKGARMYVGANEALSSDLRNVAFLRTRIDFVETFFGEDEVDEIWILFADPQIGRPRKRLTGYLFLDRYIQLLKLGGTLHLKCDSEDLYSFTKEEAIPAFNAADKGFQFEKEFDTNELYEEGIHTLDETMKGVLNIRTYYEQMWLEQGKKIKYLRYRLERSLK